MTFLRLRARQADPVVHQAYAGFAIAGDQAVQAFSVDRAPVLNLHTVSLVEAVLDIGENAAESLQRLPLGCDDQIPVNAAFQDQ